MPSPLHIKTFCLGPWMTNCYVVYAGAPDGARPCWIVDASFDPQPMLDFISREKLTPQQVVLTHAHLDHIAGLHDVRRQYPDIPIVIHEAEKDFLTDANLNLSAMLPDPVIAPQATGLLHHGDILKLDDIAFEVRHTPGHSPGGICLYQRDHNIAIVGDTLFAGSIGRYDFPTSDGRTLLHSIQTQLLSLPDNTQVFPGHGGPTTIAEERASNPYL